MKRHLLILSPVLVFVAFVGCGGGDDKPPPLASNPQTTPFIQCASIRLDEAFRKCQSNSSSVIPLILMAQQNGGPNNNTALLLAALSRPSPRTIDPIVPPQIGPNGQSCPVQVDRETSCNDDLKTALLLATSAPKADGTPAMNDAFFQKVFYLQVKAKFALLAQQMGLSPQQQLYMAMQLQTAFNAGPLAGAIGSGTMGLINGYLGSNNNGVANRNLGLNNTVASYTPAAPPNNGVTLGLGFTGRGSQPATGKSLGLNMNGPGGRGNGSGDGFTMLNSSKTANSPNSRNLTLVDQAELIKARGFGLSADSVKRQ